MAASEGTDLFLKRRRFPSRSSLIHLSWWPFSSIRSLKSCICILRVFASLRRCIVANSFSSWWVCIFPDRSRSRFRTCSYIFLRISKYFIVMTKCLAVSCLVSSSLCSSLVVMQSKVGTPGMLTCTSWYLIPVLSPKASQSPTSFEMA